MKKRSSISQQLYFIVVSTILGAAISASAPNDAKATISVDDNIAINDNGQPELTYYRILLEGEKRNEGPVDAVLGQGLNFVLKTYNLGNWESRHPMTPATLLVESVNELQENEINILPLPKIHWPSVSQNRYINPGAFSLSMPKQYSNYPPKDGSKCGVFKIRFEYIMRTAHDVIEVKAAERKVRYCGGNIIIGDNLGNCSNGIDDDNDGLSDTEDPGCYKNGDVTDSSAYQPQKNSEANGTCGDGIDGNKNGTPDANDPVCHTDLDGNNPLTYDITLEESTTIPATLAGNNGRDATYGDGSINENKSNGGGNSLLQGFQSSLKGLNFSYGQKVYCQEGVYRTINVAVGAVPVISLFPLIFPAVSFFTHFLALRRKKDSHWVKVVDSVTGKGVGDAIIEVITPDGKVRGIWKTDKKTGNAGDLLPLGIYEFSVKKDGWRFPSMQSPSFPVEENEFIYRSGKIDISNLKKNDHK